MPLSRDIIRMLIDQLGEEGAKAGLDRSFHSAKELRSTAVELKATIPPKAMRKDIVASIIAKVNQRIEKTQEELLAMSVNDLLEYFEYVRPSKAELLSVLGELDFHPGSEAQKSLYKYAARQIAETGMFKRVASNT